jgi:chromate transport protein ChrA
MSSNPLTEYLQKQTSSLGTSPEDSDDISTGKAGGIVIGALLLGAFIAVLVFAAASGLIAIALTGIFSALAGNPVNMLVLGMQLAAGVAGVALIWRIIATRRKQTLSLDLKGLL